MVKALSLNVRGLRQRKKRYNLFQWLKKENYDVVALQETYVLEKDIEYWSKLWGGQFYATPGSAHSKGNILLIGKNAEVSNVVYTEVDERTQVVTFQRDGCEFVVINCYGPCEDEQKCAYLEQLNNVCTEYNSDTCKLILLGDFNVILNNSLDNIAGKPHESKIVEKFNNFVSNNNLLDLWRSLHPNSKCFTWKRSRLQVARRLDYVFLNENVSSDAVECNIVPYPASDHDGVEVTFEFGDVQNRGPGYFKINNSILCEDDYVQDINNVIQETVQTFEQVVDPQMLWDICKTQIRTVTQIYCVNRARKKRDITSQLKAELKELGQQMAQAPDDALLLAKYEAAERKYELHLDYVSKGAYIRSKTNWLEKGEKNTKFFLSLEKFRARQKVISRLSLDDGIHVSDQTEIGECIYKHFQQLYTEGEKFKRRRQMNILWV